MKQITAFIRIILLMVFFIPLFLVFCVVAFLDAEAEAAEARARKAENGTT